MRWSRKVYAQWTAATLVVFVVWNVVRLALNQPRPLFTPGTSVLLSIVEIALFSGAAIAFALRHRVKAFLSASWGLGFLSLAALLSDGMMLVLVNDRPAMLLSLAGAGLVAFLMKRSFDRGLLEHTRDPIPRSFDGARGARS